MSTGLIGCTINSGVFASGSGITTQAQADAFWTDPETTGCGLPLDCCKMFYSGGISQYPTSISSREQTLINDGVGLIPCFEPTVPFVPAELTACEASLNMWIAGGATIPAVVFYSEVNQGVNAGKLSASQYLALVTAFQDVRSIAPVYLDAAGHFPSVGPDYWDASLHDGIGIDYYSNSYSASPQQTVDWASNLAIAAGCPFGIFEMGNNKTQGDAAPFPAYMAYLTNLFQTRAAAGQPPGPCMWWNSTGPGLGYAHLTDTSDARLPYIRTLWNAVNAGNQGPYDVCSQATGASGTTISQVVGTGALDTPVGSKAGDLVYVLIGCPTTSQTIVNVTDSKGNTYIPVNSYSAGSSTNQWLYASLTTHALVAGTDTITVTFNLSSGNKSMIVRGCPGVAAATPDQAVAAPGSSVSPSVVTGTLAANAELVVGGIANGSAAGAPLNVSFGVRETLNQNNYVTIFDEIVSSNNAVTSGGTLSSSGNWSATATTFKLGSGSPVVRTTSLPPGIVGATYSGSVSAKGGTKPYTWSLNSGTLPTGMTLGSAGVIKTTPSAAGTYTFTVKVTDANGLTAVSSSLSIVISATAVSVTTGTLATGTQGLAYSGTESASGGTGTGYTWAVTSGSLPPGVSLSGVGALTGTPTTPGTYPFTVQVTDSSGLTATASQSIIINPSGAAGGAIAAILIDVPGVSQAGRDKWGSSHGVSTAPAVSSGVLSQAEEQCLVFVADASGGGTPAWGSGWTALTAQADGGSHVILGAAYQTVTATTSVTGSATITSAAWSAAIITEAVDAPNLSTILSNGIQGIAYSQTLEATGGLGAYTYTVTSGSLPPGLTLAGSVISGTPTATGSYTFTLTATDAHGFAASEGETVTIVIGGASPATAQVMPGNLLTVGDSDFEAGMGCSWIGQTNATGVAPGGIVALTGSRSLRWKATADGSTSVKTGVYSGILGGKPYIVSGYMLSTSNQTPNLWIGVNWYTSTGTFISSSSNGGVALNNALQWQGIQAGLVAPSNAAEAEVFVTVDEANAADYNFLDLAFFAQTDAQVLIDFVNPAFSVNSQAGSNFLDASPFLRLDTGITISTRGRTDAISEVSTGSASFPLQNDGGWFTEDNIDSVAVVMGGMVTLQARCQINLADENGVWYTRFDGQVSNITYSVDPTGNTNLSTISVADILAPLYRQDPLECWTKQQVLVNGPLYHWSLSDAPNISGELYTLAAESSGNNGPPLKLVRSAQAGAATIAWNDSTGGVETLADAFAPGEPDASEYWPTGSRVPSNALRGLDSGAVGPFTTPLGNVYFTPTVSSGSGRNQFVNNTGYQLQAQLPVVLHTVTTPDDDFSLEAWFTMDPAIGSNVAGMTGPYTVFSLGSSRRSQPVLVAGVFQPSSGNIPEAGMALYSGPPAFAANNFSTVTVTDTAHVYSPFPELDTIQRPHHLVVHVKGDASSPAVNAYVDGNWIGSINLPTGTTFDTITVGGAYGGGGCFYGSISMVSLYGYRLTPDQINLDCQLGQYGMWELPTDDCIAQLATYANIPPFWNGVSAQHNGLSLTDYYDITGGNAYTSMTVYEQTEGGLLFVNAAGQLTFHTRDWRMGYGPPKVNLPPDSYSEQLGLEVLDTYQTNEDAVASMALPGGASYINQASQAQFGTYAVNPVGSPATLAHISYSRGYGAAGLQEYSYWPDPNMEDAAAWAANSKSGPWFSIGSLVIDVLTPGGGINVSNIYSLEIDDVVALSGTLPQSLPNAPLSNEFFIEGIGETIATTARTVTLYVSPAKTQRAWVPGDATYGVLSSTARIGISSSDVSPPQADGKDVSHDGGPPYWAPSFSAGMNSPAGTGGFVGSGDIRGLVWPLQQILQPPIAAVGQESHIQPVAQGALNAPQLFWDTIACDSQNGMGILPGYPNWYVVLQAGFYEIDAGVSYTTQSTGGGSGMMGWLVVAENAAQVVVTGVGDPTTVNQYVCPIGESVREDTVGMNAVAAPTTRLYLGLGDMITVAAEQNANASINTANSPIGSRLSVRFVGLGTEDDRCQINSSLASGGIVSTPVPITHGTNTYQAQHTFSHYGFDAKRGGSTLANKDGLCWQGNPDSGFTVTGPQFTLIRFPWAQMAADLGSKQITSVTLQGTNNTTKLSTGVTLIGGYYYTNNEGSQWVTDSQNPAPAKSQWTQQFPRGKTLTFTIPASQFQQYFIQNGAHGIMIGDDAKDSQGYNFYGSWQGGPNSWTLKVSY